MRSPKIDYELLRMVKEICLARNITDADCYFTLVSSIAQDIKVEDREKAQDVFDALADVSEIYIPDQKAAFFAIMTLAREMLTRIKILDSKDLN